MVEDVPNHLSSAQVHHALHLDGRAHRSITNRVTQHNLNSAARHVGISEQGEVLPFSDDAATSTGGLEICILNDAFAQDFDRDWRKGLGVHFAPFQRCKRERLQRCVEPAQFLLLVNIDGRGQRIV